MSISLLRYKQHTLNFLPNRRGRSIHRFAKSARMQVSRRNMKRLIRCMVTRNVLERLGKTS